MLIILCSKKPDVKVLAVGMDGRTHSPAFKEEITRGLLDSGLDLIFIGVCPSPVLYLHYRHYRLMVAL